MAIHILEQITLGGVPQWLTIRGANESLPLLLFLHGGPGSPQTGAQHKYNAALEQHYLVVNWDQRGAGKSYNPMIPKETMNVAQLIADAHELTLYLLERFGQSKLFLMGHSIGAMLGMLFSKQYPELVQAHVAINLPVHRKLEEELSYDYVLERAEAVNNRKAMAALKKIGPPVNGIYDSTEGLVVQRTWLTKLGGVTYRKNAMLININYMLSSHLNWREKLSFMKGFAFSADCLWNELCGINLFTLVPEVQVPVYIIMGRHDRIVQNLSEQYFEVLQAPQKELIIFEKSGHLALFEEPQHFNELMIHKVRALAA
jgi:proline iminopeptidase